VVLVQREYGCVERAFLLSGRANVQDFGAGRPRLRAGAVGGKELQRHPFFHHRSNVCGDRSRESWPWWPPQRAQWHSMRVWKTAVRASSSARSTPRRDSLKREGRPGGALLALPHGCPGRLPGTGRAAGVLILPWTRSRMPCLARSPRGRLRLRYRAQTTFR
jgi:hypothetical protein